MEEKSEEKEQFDDVNHCNYRSQRCQLHGQDSEISMNGYSFNGMVATPTNNNDNLEYNFQENIQYEDNHFCDEGVLCQSTNQFQKEQEQISSVYNYSTVNNITHCDTFYETKEQYLSNQEYEQKFHWSMISKNQFNNYYQSNICLDNIICDDQNKVEDKMSPQNEYCLNPDQSMAFFQKLDEKKQITTILQLNYKNQNKEDRSYLGDQSQFNEDQNGFDSQNNKNNTFQVSETLFSKEKNENNSNNELIEKCVDCPKKSIEEMSERNEHENIFEEENSNEIQIDKNVDDISNNIIDSQASHQSDYHPPNYEKKKYICPYCEKSYVHYTSLSNHLKKDHQVSGKISNHIKMNKNGDQLDSMQKQYREQNTCKDCNISYKYLSGLHNHVRFKHKSDRHGKKVSDFAVGKPNPNNRPKMIEQKQQPE